MTASIFRLIAKKWCVVACVRSCVTVQARGCVACAGVLNTSNCDAKSRRVSPLLQYPMKSLSLPLESEREYPSFLAYSRRTLLFAILYRRFRVSPASVSKKRCSGEKQKGAANPGQNDSKRRSTSHPLPPSRHGISGLPDRTCPGSPACLRVYPPQISDFHARSRRSGSGSPGPIDWGRTRFRIRVRLQMRRPIWVWEHMAGNRMHGRVAFEEIIMRAMLR